MRRAVYVISALALVAFLASSAWIGRLERAGPAHQDVMLAGGIPATLYLPLDASDPNAFLDVPPPGRRPPAVVLMHGFASDRMGMSHLARRLAGSGFAVLTLDVRGHGENRNPFDRSRATGGTFYPDLAAAVDFLRAFPHVDGSRIAVMGHSMGAGAALDYGTRDPAIAAVVLISGGWKLEGPYRPPNALFLYAVGDPGRIKGRSKTLASQLAGVDRIDTGRTYGDIASGNAVRLVEIPGADHVTIIWTDSAVAEIAAWLGSAFGVPVPARAPADPRTGPVLVALLAVLLALPGLGLLIGRLVPARAADTATMGWQGLLVVAVGLVVTLPLLAAGTPGPILSLEVGDVILTHFFLCGVALLVVTALWRPAELKEIPQGLGQTLLGAGVGVVAVYLLLNPIGLVVHRMTLTPERLLVFPLATAAILPFSLAFQILVRRGATPVASLWAVLGRIVVIAVIFAGVKLEVIPGVVILMAPALGLVFVLLEVFAAALYSASRNRTAIAIIDAAWIALIFSAAMPIRL